MSTSLLSKSFFQNYFRTILLMVLAIFVNLLMSPVSTFAQETSDKSQEIFTEFSPHNGALLEYVSPSTEELNDCIQSESITTMSKITATKSIDSLALVIIPLNAQYNIEKKPDAELTTPVAEKWKLLAPQMWITVINYIVVDGAAPAILKEFIKRSVNKSMRNIAFVGQYKAAYNSAESGIHLRRSLAELIKNTNRLILSENNKGNYQEVGKIIRTSLIGHMVIAIPQVGIGFLVAPTFVKMGLPASIGSMVENYLKWGSFGVLSKELSGRTGENILIIEHPEMEFLPTLINSGLMAIIYFGPSQALKIGQLSRLAVSETLAMSATTVLLLSFLSYDEKYSKYQLFDFSKDKLTDYVNTFFEIQDYSVPVFVSNLCFVIAESADILMDAIIGGEGALKARSVFTLFSLFISPISLANAQQSGRVVAKSLATNETKTTIKNKMQQGLLTNFLVSTPYFIFILAPNLVYQGDRNHIQDGIVRILATNNIICAMQNIAREQLFGFRTEDHGWLKTVGDVTSVAVPIIGVVLFRTGTINPTLHNRLVVQIISLLPAIFTISEAALGPP